MANYIASARSNAFRVKDIAALEAALPDDIEIYVDSFPERRVALLVLIDEQSLLDTMASWATHIDSLVAQAISPEDEEAAVEQTADYFDRHIAGDR